jgi:tetratricopeptide (TPR) repeat protein
VLARVERDLRGQTVPDTPKVLTKLRILIIQDKESEARDWLSIQKSIKPDVRQQIESELAEMSMIASIVRNGTQKLPDWTKLQKLLAKDADHPMWTRLAVAMWDGSEKPEAKPAHDWVQARLDDDSAGINLLRHAVAVTSARYQTNGKTAKDSEMLRKLYRKVLAKSPDDILSLNNLSMLIYKYELDHLDEGLKYALHAQELAPQIPAIRDTVGEVLARMGRWDEALPILESCLAGLPEEWNLHNTLAQIYEQKGMNDRATAHKAAVARIKRPLDADNYDKLPLPKKQ